MRNLLKQGYYYTLISPEGERAPAYFYHNPDAECDGFGFNVADGAGFVALHDLAVESKVVMTFGQAIEAAKTGARITRQGWNGKGMYLELQTPDTDSKMTLPYLYMKTACDNQVPWLASQTDVLSEDWIVL